MTAAVEAFRGLEHAMELVAEIGGVRFVNDSKATNVESALRSIESFERGLVAIIGGRFKGGDFAAAARAAGGAREGGGGDRRGRGRWCARRSADVVDGARGGVVRRGGRAAYALAQPAGVVLLAPACASFDMFATTRNADERSRRRCAKLERAKLQRATRER